MNFYSGLTCPGYLSLDNICTTYHWNLALDKLLDLSPCVYYNLHCFKIDATCSQMSASFSDDDPLSTLYYCFNGVISPLWSSSWNVRDTTLVEYTSFGGYDILFILCGISWDTYLIVSPWSSRSTLFIWNPLPITLTTYIVSFLLQMSLQHLIATLQLHIMLCCLEASKVI